MVPGKVANAPPAPPVTATVYLVLAAREVCGSRTHWLVVPFLKTVAGTTAPVAAFFRVNVVPLTPSTASLNVALMSLPRRTKVALLRGVVPVTVGAGPVTKVQLVEASGVPAASRMAVDPPTRVAVKVPSTARLVAGSKVAVRVVAL